MSPRYLIELHDWDDAPQTYVWGAGLIALTPDEDVTRMVDTVARRGGSTAWGISDRRSEGAVLIDPGLFAEQDPAGHDSRNRACPLAWRPKSPEGTSAEGSLLLDSRPARA